MKPTHVRQDQNHMATTFRFTVSCASELSGAATRALSEAHAWVSRLEFQLTEFKECSPIYRLNRAPVGTRITLTRPGIELLERSERLRVLTGGAYDCAAKSRSRPAVGPAVAWNTETLEAWRLDAGTHIGFGAIGKGYALDGVRLILEKAGFRDYLLSAGGSSQILSGFAAPGEPWSWGWSWSKDSDQDDVGVPFAHYKGIPMAIGVSGTHEKGDHLLDPRKSQPAASKVLSALVAAPSAADADALSTALFVAGYEQAVGFLGALPYTPALAVIDSDGVASWNGIFRNYWGQPRERTSAPAPRRSSFGATLGALGVATVFALSSPAHAKDKKEDPRAALEKAAAAVNSAAAALSAPAETPTRVPTQDTSAPAAAETAPASETAAAPTDAATPAAAAPESADGAVDLEGMSTNTFTPYVNERSSIWVLLPVLSLALVLLHLKKTRRTNVKKTPASSPAAPFSLIVTAALLWSTVEANAVDLLPMGKALTTVLGTPKAFKKTIGDATFFYSKNAAGKADKVAFVEHNVWQKSCSHTWIVGVGPDGTVLSVVAQEQQCPHARPAAADSFLDQYKGKGPADLAKLKEGINTVAKATGSCELATEAVTHAVKSYAKIKGQI